MFQRGAVRGGAATRVLALVARKEYKNPRMHRLLHSALLPFCMAAASVACSDSETTWSREPAIDAAIEASAPDGAADVSAPDGAADVSAPDGAADAPVDAGPEASTDGSAGVDGAEAGDTGKGCPAGLLCAGPAPYSSKVGLWYTLWWRTDASGHWDEWSRYVPLLGKYTSGAEASFPQELAELEAMGADFLLLDHTNGIGADGGGLATAGHKIVAALEGGVSSLQQATALGACFWLSGITDRLGCMAQEAETIWGAHANPALHPSAYLVGGRPLLVNYTSPGAYDDWSDPRFTMGAASGRSTEASAAQLAQGLWGWVFDDPTPQSGVVMGVMPGWDTQHLGRPTVPLAREDNGMRFQRQWLRAIHQNPESIVISSWNDFAEETAIQPAKRSDPGAPLWQDSHGNECPSFYYEIARVYSMMRWGLLIGAYVKDENSPEVYQVGSSGLVYQGAMPVCHPAVNVPAGYLSAFPKAP